MTIKMPRNLMTAISVVAFAVMLHGCGGGGGSSPVATMDDDTTMTPDDTTMAGPMIAGKTVPSGTTVTLPAGTDLPKVTFSGDMGETITVPDIGTFTCVDAGGCSVAAAGDTVTTSGTIEVVSLAITDADILTQLAAAVAAGEVPKPVAVDLADLTAGYVIAAGTIEIPAGGTVIHGDVALTCSGSEACTVTVADDGTVTSLGGACTAANSPLYVAKLEAALSILRSSSLKALLFLCSAVRVGVSPGSEKQLLGIKNALAGGGVMNASPPSASPAACVRGAGRRGPHPIGPCAGTVAKSGARPSAQDARRPRRLAYHTAAETRNGAARLRVTGAGGAIGPGRTLARARAAAPIHPLKAARCANRAAWHGVTGSGNNMPRGGPPVCAAGAVRRRPVMPRAATGALGARPNAQEKRRRMQEAASVTADGAPGGFASIVPHRPRARPGVPRAPAGPGRVRASIAVCRFCHLELRSSRSPRASITGHGTGGKMSWSAWPSPSFPGTRWS